MQMRVASGYQVATNKGESFGQLEAKISAPIPAEARAGERAGQGRMLRNTGSQRDD